MSRDPIGFSGGGNLWGYVGNNPISRIDPFGNLGSVIFYSDDFRDMGIVNVQKLWGYSLDMPYVIREWDMTDSKSLVKSLFNARDLFGPLDRFVFIGHGTAGSILINGGEVKLHADLADLLCPPNGPLFSYGGRAVIFSCHSGESPSGPAANFSRYAHVLTVGVIGFSVDINGWVAERYEAPWDSFHAGYDLNGENFNPLVAGTYANLFYTNVWGWWSYVGRWRKVYDN